MHPPQKCVPLLLCFILVAIPTTVDGGRKCGRKKSGTKCNRRQRERKSDTGEVTPDLPADDIATRQFRVGKVESTKIPEWSSKSKMPKDVLIAHRAGSDVTFRCKAKGQPRPKVTWDKDGKEMKLRRHKGPGDEKHKKGKWTLQVTKLTLGDTGNYTCHVTNAAGHIQWTYYLRVLENQPISEINILEKPKNQTAHVGDNVVFMCRSDTWPAPKVYWTRSVKNKPAMEIMSEVSENSTLQDLETLRLHNVSKGDAGQYTCFIGNEMAHLQLSATLTVIDTDESLPFEPRCGLHFRQQILVDNTFGCQTPEPVEMNYCMGTCGRSYFIPTIVTADDPNMQMNHLNQTCHCCVGIVDQLRIVKLKCPEGRMRKGFFTLYKDCHCQDCSHTDHRMSKAQVESNTVSLSQSGNG